MNKCNFDIELIGGIDTLEVTTSTYLPPDTFAFITHDSTRRYAQDEGREPKYKYRFNPDKTHFDTSTLMGYKAALDTMITTTAVINPVKTRIDFRFDNYASEYTNTFKLNKLLVLLIAEKYDIKNRYQCIDLLTAELKTLCIKNKYIEAEAYNKAIEEPGSLIQWRLELRSKALYDDEDEENKELRELNKWYVRLADATTTANFNALINEINIHLMRRYAEQKAKGEFARDNEFIVKYADFIFSTRQLTDLYKRMGYARPEKQTTTYRKNHKIEFFSLGQIRNYVLDIRRSAGRFTEESQSENIPKVG